jgi:hypothetical protein
MHFILSKLAAKKLAAKYMYNKMMDTINEETNEYKKYLNQMRI